MTRDKADATTSFRRDVSYPLLRPKAVTTFIRVGFVVEFCFDYVSFLHLMPYEAGPQLNPSFLATSPSGLDVRNHPD